MEQLSARINSLSPSATIAMNQKGRELKDKGVDVINLIAEKTSTTIIGLIKKEYDDCEVYITPTSAEVDALLASPCEVIALDATERMRPGGEQLADLIKKVHEAGRLVLADCDSYASGQYAVECGADFISSTLAGYTPDSIETLGPDLDLLRQFEELGVPFLAEGRFTDPWQVFAAKRIGAFGVVVGGALNDPMKQTTRLASRANPAAPLVAAYDIGGTWLRFGLFNDDWDPLVLERIETPSTHTERLAWMTSKAMEHKAPVAAISSGGLIHPATGVVIQSKELIGDNQAKLLQIPDVTTFALNDGLATAWGHACHPDYAGLNVASLALGTGVGSGFVQEMQFVPRSKGYPSEINDLFSSLGTTIEEACGGLNLDASDQVQRENAVQAARDAIHILQSVYRPHIIVLSGGVGLSDWMQDGICDIQGVEKSPFGKDAGLFGAAALALYPPIGVFEE